MVEGARLEIVCTGDGTAGSNPASSVTSEALASVYGPANAGPLTPPGPEGSNGRGVQRVAGPF